MRDTAKSKTTESGAVLTLVAILSSILLALLAIVIDLQRALVSKEQAQHFTRLAALAALEEYFAADDCGTLGENPTCRVERAYQKASVILARNNLSMVPGVNPEMDIDTLEGNQAVFKAGRWLSGENCTEGESPCFVEGVSEGVNAIKIVGTMYHTSMLRLARLAFNTDSLPVRVSATSSAIPRHGCFLIDISRSIVKSTHTGIDEYAYFLSGEQLISGFPLYYRNNDHSNWLSLNEYYPERGSNITDPEVHYASDYRRKYIMGDDDYSSALYPYNAEPQADRYSAGPGWWTRVDTFGDENYEGPEPLTSVFNGLSHALSYFDENRVAGDKVCLVFFDETLGWPRVFPLTSEIDQLLNYVNFSITEAIVDDAGSNSSIGSSGREQTIRHGLLTLPMESDWTKDIEAHSDSYAALDEALYQFTNTDAGDIPVGRFVVHIGDGLANCIPCEEDDCSNRCQNNYDRYLEAFTAIQGLVATEYVSKRIPIHFILLGDHVGPHTVDFLEDSTCTGDDCDCMTDTEYRSSNSPDPFGFVRGSAADGYSLSARFDRMAADRPFFEAAHNIYRLAVATGGLYSPVRSAGTDCPAVGDRAPCYPGQRRMTDPYCRGLRDQIRDTMEEILGRNPFVIVEVENRL
jgi:hypothetical protein